MGSAPRSAPVQLVVADVEAARAELVGVDVSEVQEFAWGSFVFFADPDSSFERSSWRLVT